MPDPVDANANDLVHYLGILEAVVAVLAIKSGLNPETLVGKAIEDITEQTGMETLDTERIIRERWQGRNLTAGKLVAQALPATLEDTPLPTVATDLASAAVVGEPPPQAESMTARFRSYQERLKSLDPTVSDAEDPTTVSENASDASVETSDGTAELGSTTT